MFFRVSERNLLQFLDFPLTSVAAQNREKIGTLFLPVHLQEAQDRFCHYKTNFASSYEFIFGFCPEIKLIQLIVRNTYMNYKNL